jgi:hypothetical protein
MNDKKSVLRKVIRFFSDYGGIPLIVGIVFAVVALAVWFCAWIGRDLKTWIAEMNEPTERGLAYIAIAIVVHAFVARSSVNVDVKQPGKSV